MASELSRSRLLRITAGPLRSVGVDGSVGSPSCQIPPSVGGWWAWGTDRRSAGWSGRAHKGRSKCFRCGEIMRRDELMPVPKASLLEALATPMLTEASQ